MRKKQDDKRWRGPPLILAFSALMIITACGVTGTSQNRRFTSSLGMSSPTSYELGYGRILRDSPFIASGDNLGLSPATDLSKYLSAPLFLTLNSQLSGNCQPDSTDTGVMIEDCYSTKKDPTSSYIASNQGRWIFRTTTPEFMQVNTFGHVKKAVDRFLGELSKAHASANPIPEIGNGSGAYATSIPAALLARSAYWYSQTKNGAVINNLVSYAQCASVNNSSFSPANFELCFGTSPDYLGLDFAEDPSIIYHEIMHAFVKIMMNQRNMTYDNNLANTNKLTLRSDMGSVYYDEMSAINEGMSDFFSHLMNNRLLLGEWALGLFFNAARPISEDAVSMFDGKTPVHTTGISSAIDERLSYPEWINYDPAQPTKIIEEVHYGGMPASHFLVRLSEELKTNCSFTHEVATGTIIQVLAETMAELGDLTTKGSDHRTSNFVNHVPSPLPSIAATPMLWSEIVNPPNYRRFFQTFAKFFNYRLNAGLISCGGRYTFDNLQVLMDSYGLLLFKTLNENGNGYSDSDIDGIPNGFDTVNIGGLPASPTQVNPLYRAKSVLVTKSQLSSPLDTDSYPVFFFDTRKDMKSLIDSFVMGGKISPDAISDLIPSDLSYNNANGRPSPGEIFGVALNLYNRSNTTMGGVHVLGNDWDHGKVELSDGTLRPCNNFDDAFPLDSEGAASTDTGILPGDCRYTTRTNGGDGAGDRKEVLAPVCWARIKSQNETRWVGQKELLDHFTSTMGLDSSACLHFNSSDSEEVQLKSLRECFIKTIPGLDHSWYSRISPSKTWAQTQTGGTGSPEFNPSNLIVFEVSPWVPPGTMFDCRFRATFSNCDDCWNDPLRTDGEDYLDYEYSGARPYKIIHLQFTVLD